MNKQIEQMISELLIDEEAKQSLKVIDRVLNSDSELVRGSAYIPLVIAGEGCGFTSFGRVYSAIVDASAAQPIRGTSTFLDLVFPKDNERDESLFFASPRTAASVRNRFYGTMLISFKEFDGRDLTGSASFKNLLEFMENNIDNIRFVLHITPDFTAKAGLISALQSIAYVEEICLDVPDARKGCDYLTDQLKRQGIVIDKEAVSFLRKTVLPELVSRKTYAGYKTLNTFLARLALEAAIIAESSDCRIDKALIAGAMDKVGKHEGQSDSDTRRIGFRI